MILIFMEGKFIDLSDLVFKPSLSFILPVFSVVPDDVTLMSAVVLVMCLPMMRGIQLVMTEDQRVEGRRLGRPHLSLHPRVASASSSNGDGGLVLRHPFESGDPPAGVSLRICLWQLWIGLDK